MKQRSRLLSTLALVVFFGGGAVPSIAPGAAPDQDTELFAELWTTGISGHGTATIDGVMHLQEWRHAGAVDLLVNVPGGGITLATLYVMNDQNNLYIALKFKRPALDPASTLAIELDSNHSGVLDAGDDVFLLNPNPAVGFQDDFRATCTNGEIVCGVTDTSLGGTNDGAGAVSNDGTYTMYELAHPLNSGDPYDIALARNETVGFIVHLRLFNSQGVMADTEFPISNLYLAKIQIR